MQSESTCASPLITEESHTEVANDHVYVSVLDGAKPNPTMIGTMVKRPGVATQIDVNRIESCLRVSKNDMMVDDEFARAGLTSDNDII